MGLIVIEVCAKVKYISICIQNITYIIPLSKGEKKLGENTIRDKQKNKVLAFMRIFQAYYSTFQVSEVHR